MTQWAENDELFISELKKGHQWQTLPQVFFQLQGLKVEMPDLSVRSNIAEAGHWINTTDLIVEGNPLEVKSRDEAFTAPDTFPYSTIIVDTVAGFDAKKEKPIAYIMISRKTGCMLALASNSQSQWEIQERFDHVRKITDKFYFASTSLLRPLNTLVNFLRKNGK